MSEKENCKHITVRMPVDLVKKMEELANLHHRDRTGEIIHACAVYVAAHYQTQKGWDQEIHAMISCMIAEELAKYDIRQTPHLNEDK